MIEITKEMRINCVTHNDMDGVFCGLVIRRKYPQAIVFQTNYGRPIDDRWFDCDVLFVTDYSFDGLKTLQSLDSKGSPKLVWIDHHIIVDEAIKENFNPEGLRRKDVSAAHLCWEYCYPGTAIPTVIKYISDYDIWKWQDNINALYFQNAIRNSSISINQKSGTEFFNALLTKQNLLDRFVANGKKIEDFNDLRRKLVCDDGGFYTKIDGVPAIACNIKTTNSTIFKFVDEQIKGTPSDVPLRILFAYFSSINGWRVSVFSNDPEKYSAHEICKKYGGGGHAGAGGFQVSSLKDLPFDIPSNSITNSRVDPIDIFHDLKVAMDMDPIVENGAKTGNTSIVYGYSFGALVYGFTACCINDPTGHPSMFYQTAKDSLYQLGVFFNMCKNGWWRYRIYVLDPTINLVDVHNVIPNSVIVDNSVIVITQAPPIPVGGTNGTN